MNMPGTESEGSTPLLVRNLEEMDQSVKQMLKLIEEDGCDDGGINSGVYQQKRPELIAHIESFCSMYRSLAEEVAKGVSKDQIHHSSPPLTPADKLSLPKSGMDMSPSSGGGSSEPSLKGGSESFSSSSSSSDSESESFNSSINNYLVSPVNLDGKEQKMCKLEADEDSGESILVGRYEEELKDAKLKLQRSEEEAARLKIELERSEADMRAQLESAQRAIGAKEADLDVERRNGLQMLEQIGLLETQLLESDLKMKQLMEEFEIEREKLKGLDEENAKLKQEHESRVSEETERMQGQLDLATEDIRVLKGKLDLERVRVSELEENIVKYKAEVSDCDHEIKELEAALCDAHENFSNEKAQLHSETNAKLNEWESRSKSLEDKLTQSEAERLEMKSSTEMLKSMIHDLNKTLDGLKHKHDNLMTEKDMANAKIETLIAEASAKDNQIQQKEEHIGQLCAQNTNLASDSETARNLADELRLKVKELEQEVERLEVAISNGAEEKREAIRQLCFSLEHYKSGYQELRQAFVGQKRRAVMAS